MDYIKLYGTKYGGFYLPNKMNIDKDSIIYCVGVGEDISFDIAMMDTYKCNTFLFDPTPRACTHFNTIIGAIQNKIKIKYDKHWGGGDSNYLKYVIKPIDTSKIHYYNYGVYTDNNTLKFYEPVNKDHVSYTLDPTLRKVGKSINIPVKKLSTIMKTLNHDEIDLIKLDIEGVESEVIIQMLDENIFPTYLCVDFDARRANKKVDLFNKCMKKLEDNNYRMCHNENYNITFIKIK